MIELDRVTKLYGLVIGVNDLTLSLEPGAYGLLGPNGSGKTTLINLITGQLKPTMGRVRVFGKTPWNHDELLRRLGYCPALDPSHWNVSGLEWVSYLLQLGGMAGGRARDRAAASLADVGLSESMERPMHTYSLGMRQRVKLAQAFAHDPDWLILDEPFNGLDPLGRRQMTETLRRWIENGKSLLLASHVLHEVEAITDAFLLLYNGRLLASGRAAEIGSILRNENGQLIVRGGDLLTLAEHLISDPAVRSVSFSDDRRELTLYVRIEPAFFERLQGAIADLSVDVDEIDAPRDSLATIFSVLVQVHHGEMVQEVVGLLGPDRPVHGSSRVI